MIAFAEILVAKFMVYKFTTIKSNFLKRLPMDL